MYEQKFHSVYVISIGFYKNKLRVYRELKENFECKQYLHGISDMGSKLFLSFRSETHSMDEELGTKNSSKHSANSKR